MLNILLRNIYRIVGIRTRRRFLCERTAPNTRSFVLFYFKYFISKFSQSGVYYLNRTEIKELMLVMGYCLFVLTIDFGVSFKLLFPALIISKLFSFKCHYFRCSTACCLTESSLLATRRMAI
jgi:hypothetical protein